MTKEKGKVVATSMMGYLVVVLVMSSCTESEPNSQINRTEDEKKQDRRCLDGSCFDDSGQPDVSTESDAALDAQIVMVDDASEYASNSCRVVDPEEDLDDFGLDDAGIEEEPQDPVVVRGLIVRGDECFSGVQVCISNDSIPSRALVTTDRYGQFVYRASFSDSQLSITPRKDGFVFEPEKREGYFGVDRDETNQEPFKFVAIPREYPAPAHATGRWRVIEDEVIRCLAPFYSCSSDFDRTGTILEFKYGCLFGGVDCVSGLEYTDKSGFCSPPWPPWPPAVPLVTPIYTTGQFDPDTQIWIITKSITMYDKTGKFILTGSMEISGTMVLERVTE